MDDFLVWSRRVSDWSSRYRLTIGDRVVRPKVRRGAVESQIPADPPEGAESMDTIFEDFERIIPDNMTHWQHPRFFAYFQSNAAWEAQIAEQLATAFAAQCMLWQTSPAATELEIRMVDWLRRGFGLPDDFSGTFQDSASSSNLCSILTMRERALNFAGNESGLSSHPPLRVYASSHAHSSVRKAVWISGLGDSNLVSVPASGASPYGMDTDALHELITSDRASGFIPAGVVACIGATSVGASDDVSAVCDVASEHNLFVHLDAAWAGSAMICPEFRDYWSGSDRVDSITVNPHKWLGVPFDCSLYLVRDRESLLKTLAVRPAYLETRNVDDVVNFSEWSVQLGRSFRALKVWFLVRAYGLSGLRARIRDHVRWSRELCDRLRSAPNFEITTAPILSLFSFRHVPPGVLDLPSLNRHNVHFLDALNDDGRIYVTRTVHDDRVVIRFVCGQFDMTHSDLDIAYDAITEVASRL